MASHFWKDGGTRRVYIAERFGLFPELRLVMRTTTSAQIRAADRELRETLGADEEVKAKKIAEFIAGQIVQWDAADEGNKVPCTADNILLLQPELYSRLSNIAYGVDGGDRDPQLEEPHREDTATRREQEGNSAAA